MANPLYADRIMEVTTTTGTGAIALGGAVTGYRTFASVYANGDPVFYAISNGTDWEVGKGTLSGTPVATLTRTTVRSSSNGGAAVNFGAGSKNVWVDLPASELNAWPTDKGGTGQDFSASNGFLKFVTGVASVVALAAGVESFLTAPSSANLAAAVTDPTGSGSLVFATSPTFGTSITLQRNSIGAATTALGIAAQNATAATASVNQNGPAIWSGGYSWDTVNLVSRQMEMGLFTQAISGSGVADGLLTLAVRQNGTSLTVGGFTISRLGITTVTRAGIAASLSTQAFVAANLAASTSGTPVQNSPSYWWQGSAYNSNTGLSEAQYWFSQVLPVSNAGTTTSLLSFYRQVNGGNSVLAFSIDSGAVLNVGPPSGAVLQTNASVIINQGTNGTNQRDGLLLAARTASTVGTPVHRTQRIRFQTSAWNTGSSASDAKSASIDLLPISGSTTAFTLNFYADSNDSNGAKAMLTMLSVGGFQLPTTAQANMPTPASGSLNVGYDGTNMYAKTSAGTVKTITWT